jgi:hypothetical protein
MKKSAMLLCLLCSAQTLQATLVTVYNNYGATPVDPTSGNAVTNGSVDMSPSVAFTVPGTINLVLNQILFTASVWSSDVTNSVTLSIEQNNGGVPGTVIFTSGPITNAMGTLGSAALPTIDYTTVSANTSLLAGATYWLTLDAPTSEHVTWGYNSDGIVGTEEFQQSGFWTSAQKQVGAFEIIASTPEPSTLTLLAVGLCLIMFGCRSRLNS